MWTEEGGGNCRHCGVSLEGAFCASCGQPPAQRLSVKRVMGDWFSHVFSLNSTLARTVIGLTRRPGELIRGYIAGDRLTLLNPAHYVFLAASLYAVIILVFEIDVRPTAGRVEDERAVDSMRAVVSGLGYLLFIYLVPAAWVLHRLYRKWKLNFAEAYAGLLFYSGHYLLFLSVSAGLGLFSWSGGFWVARLGGFLVLLWFLRDWFRASIVRTVLSGFVVWLLITLGGFFAGFFFVLVSGLLKGYWVVESGS